MSIQYAVQSFLKKRMYNSATPSYSQSGEDMIIHFILKNLKIEKPTYIDIGAYHPERLSNTAFFYNSGCSGINIEPNPMLFRAFVRYRPRDLNLNIGISDVAGEMDFFVMSADTLSTFSRDEADKFVKEHGYKVVKTTKLQVKTVSDILANINTKYPDFLSLDAEGVEEKILRSINFEVWSPLVICCETVPYSATGIVSKNYEVVDYLKSKGYMVYADTYINTIFVLRSAWESR
jgi:FkbM family methyltransferase